MKKDWGKNSWFDKHLSLTWAGLIILGSLIAFLITGSSMVPKVVGILLGILIIGSLIDKLNSSKEHKKEEPK